MKLLQSTEFELSQIAATDWVEEVRVKFKPNNEEVKDLQWTIGGYEER